MYGNERTNVCMCVCEREFFLCVCPHMHNGNDVFLGEHMHLAMAAQIVLTAAIQTNEQQARVFYETGSLSLDFVNRL